MQIGTKLGAYDVIAKLGEGGMGEVYRARDTKLGRDVAIKILPESFATDPERLARFEREAKTLAQLNHPNIAQVHGFEDSGATRALVMELVDGEDLSARIARGPIPLDEAMPLARQIADALAAAHDAGIIHRDLKPANIKVRDDGTVKVLDFGLAKALTGSAGSAGSAGSEGLANSPTITTPAMTAAGLILGTAAYMSPEQAKGRPVDKRADIWAFGCVVYEMLTGRRAFAGEDVSETLASILKTPPDLIDVPVSVRPLIESCLEKDPRRRLRDIGDVWRLLDASSSTLGSFAGTSSWNYVAWTLAGIGVAAAAIVGLIHLRETPPRLEPISFQIAPPEGWEFDIYILLSPDGRRLAFTARDEIGTVRLWVRDLRTLEAHALPGTEGAGSPFWSPDGRYLAFATGRQLKKIDVSGGPPQTLCELPHIVGSGSWSTDNVLLFGSRGGGTGVATALGIYRVGAAGGTPVQVTTPDPSRGETFHSFPVFLPDRRHFVYLQGAPTLEGRRILVGSLDIPPNGQDTKGLVSSAFSAGLVISSSDSAALLYLRDGALLSHRFDLRNLTLTGQPTVVAEGVGASGSFGFFSATSDGVLAYRLGTAVNPNETTLTWFDCTGKPLSRFGERANHGELAISPDGRQLAITRSPTPGVATDIWLTDLGRDVTSRFSFQTSFDAAPIWSPDGQRVVFRSNRSTHFDLYDKPANSSEDERVLLESSADKTPTSWSPDGRFVLYDSVDPKSLSDIWALPVDGDRKPMPVLQTPFNESQGTFSPDGRWVAYASNESGRSEIYVRPFVPSGGAPPTTGKVLISKDGGVRPRWRGDGKELFFHAVGSNALMSVRLSTSAAGLDTQAPVPLFDTRLASNIWDVTNNGQRFLIAVPGAADAGPPTERPAPITVVLNWQAMAK